MRQLASFVSTLSLLLTLTSSSSASASKPSVAERADAPITTTLPAAPTDSDYYEDGSPSQAKVELGQLLFFDKILSGNRNIACATCHHPDHGSSDGLSLPFGEGPTGLGPDRAPGETIETSVHGRVPRNSPALFNLGAREMQTLFHDGRVEADTQGFYEGGFITPAKWKLPKGLDNVLAAQAMFPVTSAGEMAGQKGENDVADAISLNNAAGPGGVWELLAQRLQAIPEYVERFRSAFPKRVETADDIRFVDAANAIAAFESVAFRADQSPFDRYLRGDRSALTPKEQRGLDLFYGKANCSSCHSGTFQTDHDFHAIAMPQIGPGKADGRDASYWEASGIQVFLEDFGRGRVTVREEDNYRFRTPSLRNVALTGPWGHSGAYTDLESVVRHHLDPESALDSYDLESEFLPELGQVAEIQASGSRLDQQWVSSGRRSRFNLRDGWVLSQPKLKQALIEANELKSIELSDPEVHDLVAFLEALTDAGFDQLAQWVPAEVPSGLPVVD